MKPSFRTLDARFWRMLSIRWQREPLGSGSHLIGGRWNAVGVEALYLSSDHSTAIAEYYRSLVRPGTLAAYNVRSAKIVDLTQGSAFTALRIDPAVAACDWESIYALEKGIPPSWVVADELIAAGAHGALVPSIQNAGGTNLVLWRWNEEMGADVMLIDPERDLG